MFVIKTGSFYLVGYDDITSEYLYASGTGSAMKFKDLDELDTYIEEHKISGYAVPVKQWSDELIDTIVQSRGYNSHINLVVVLSL